MRRLKLLVRARSTVRARPRIAITLAAVLGVVLLLTGWRILRRSHAIIAPQSLVSNIAMDPLPRPTRVVSLSENCMTARCHTSMGEVPHVHAPVAQQSCGSCHAADVGGHTYPLVRPKDTLCTSCHDNGARTLVRHKAAREDECLACHDPHGSRSTALLIADSTKDNCAQCHQRHEGVVRHAANASDSCELCHEVHGSDHRSLLRASSPIENCRECHPTTVHAVETATHSHAKVEGTCLRCHDPHASPSRALLITSPRETCTKCHTDIGATVNDATVPHDAVLKGEQCARCHDAHSSEHPSMLRRTQAEICLSCHNKPVKAADNRTIASMDSLSTAPVVHGAVNHGDCSACHSVHGGNLKNLLVAVNTAFPHGQYDRRKYALCFSCHDPRLAESAARTQFRDGDSNLHEAHLRTGERSIGCGACHAVHDAELPRLIAKSVKFEGSTWAMPMGFTLTKDGGTCASACHETLEYSRKPGGVRATRKGGAP